MFMRARRPPSRPSFATAPKVAAMALTTRLVIEAMGPRHCRVAADHHLPRARLDHPRRGWRHRAEEYQAAARLFSSINNVGFMLIGLAAGTPAGVQAVLTYLLVYVVTTLGAFLVVLNLRDSDGQPMSRALARLRDCPNARAGWPPRWRCSCSALRASRRYFGFWPKYLVFEAAVLADLVPLAVAGIVASVISAFYYIAIIKTMYFDDVADVQWGAAWAVARTRVIAAAPCGCRWSDISVHPAARRGDRAGGGGAVLTSRVTVAPRPHPPTLTCSPPRACGRTMAGGALAGRRPPKRRARRLGRGWSRRRGQFHGFSDRASCAATIRRRTALALR